MEEWKEVKGYEGIYEISNTGKVKSNRSSILLKLRKTKDGYPTCSLCLNGIKKKVLIHRLVCIAFILNPEKKKTVNHKDGIKTNNNVSNLEWATNKENNIHAWENGLIKPPDHNGELNPKSKLSLNDVKEIRAIGKREFQYVLAKRYGVTQANISSILIGKSW